MAETNETYRITVSSPLLRPGLLIETEVSSKYLVPTLVKLRDKVREFNQSEDRTKEAR